MNNVDTRILVAEVPAFGELLDGAAAGEDILGYFPALLAYDLETHRLDRKVEVLCVLDTFEGVHDSSRGSLGDLISRLIYLMPNVAFILATRRPLSWSSDEDRIAHVFGGRAKWPDLREGAAYIDVEKLESQYAEEYLRISLTRGNRPVMSAAIRQRIVRDADGWPLYLDLSVDLYRSLVEKGKHPQVTDFGGPMSRLVRSVMRDMSASERDILRTACLLSSFNADTIRHALPGTRDRTISDFLERTFVKGDPSRWPRNWIHDRLRDAVVEGDADLEDGWSASEWSARALDLASYLEDEALAIWSTAPASVEQFEERGQHAVAASVHLVELARRFNIEPRRLGDVLFTAGQLGYGQTIRGLPDVPAAQASLKAVVETARVGADNSVASQRYHEIQKHLRAVRNQDYARYIKFELGPAAQDTEQYDRAVELFRDIVVGNDPMSQVAGLAYAGALLRRGELRSALASVPDHVPQHPLYRAILADLRGHVRLQGGEWSAASALFEEAFGAAQECGASLWAARARRHVAKAHMWFDSEGTREIAGDALEMNVSIGDAIGVAQCHMALAMASAQFGDWDAAFRSLVKAKSRGVSPLAVGHTGMIETLFHVALGDTSAASRAALGVLNSVHDSSARPPVWCAVTALWADREDLANFDLVEWYDSAEQARLRWLVPLETLAALR